MTKVQHRLDVKIEAATGKQVMIEDGRLISEAEFHREGADLFLTSPDGRTLMIEGYFNQNPPPDITTKDGARLTPHLVEAFLPPEHVGQYAASGQTATDASPAGKITQIQGDAVIIHADGTKVAATLGMPVVAGDVIQTSGKGGVNILFTDNTTFAISENARLSIDEYVYNTHEQSGSTFFSLLQGVFVYTSGLIGKHDASSVNIETPVGSIGIRGTVVAGEIAPAGEESKITIVDGAIVVSNTAGSLTLNSGFQTASLSSSTEAPTDSGQISVASFSQTYHAVSTIATDTFNHLDTYAAQAAAAGSPPPASEGTHTDAPAPAQPPADTSAHPGTSGEAAPVHAPVAEVSTVAVVTPVAPDSSSSFGTLASASADAAGTSAVASSSSASASAFGGTGTGSTGSSFTTPTTETTATGAAAVATTTTSTAGTNVTNTTTPNGTTGTIIPEVHFAFAPFYLHGTATTADDGLPLFMLGVAGTTGIADVGPFVIGKVVGSNLAADAVISVTGNFNGNILQYYDTGMTTPYDTTVVASQKIFSYNEVTQEITLENPWAVLPNLNPGGFTFNITVTSASTPQSNVSSTVGFKYDDMTIQSITTTPGTDNAHILIGDQTGGSANPSVATAQGDLNMGIGVNGGTNVGPDIIIGRAGNDQIYGSAGAGDVLIGGAGNDTIYAGNSAFHFVDGGAGTDTLVLGQGTGGGMTAPLNIDFTSGTAPLVRNIESINLGVSSTNQGSRIQLDIQDVFEMTDAAHTLNVLANANAVAGSSTVDVVMSSAAGNFVLTAGDVVGTSALLHYTGAYNGSTVTLVITQDGGSGVGGVAGIAVNQV